MNPGFSEHGPMVIETISTLGRNEAVPGWIDAFEARRHSEPAPPPQEPIGESEAEWRGALGDNARMTDWLQFFRRELEEQRWENILARWVPILHEGYAGGLTHGLVRTAHAVRSFSEASPPSRLQIDELAHALAYWAGNYRIVIGNPDRHGGYPLDEALRRLPRVIRDRPADPYMVARLEMQGLTGFTDIVESLQPVRDVGTAINQHAASFARVIFAHPELRPVPLISLIHAITAPVAMRNLLPYLPTDKGVWAYARLWKVSAALVAQIAGAYTPIETHPEIGEPKLGYDELIDRVVAHRDEHVVKLTEALLREDKIRPDPIFRTLAEAVLQRLPPLSRA
jgi:hypothetical protein